MKILVTGSCGFIGINLLNWLDGRHDLSAMDIKLTEHHDITDIDNCMEWARGKDCIVHLAALPGVPYSIIKPMESITVNAFGTINLLEAAMANDVKKVILASSNAANDKDSSPYAFSKWIAEYVMQLTPIDGIILRLANVYGPHSQHKTSLVANAIKALKNGHQINLYGDGSHSRDFIHVDDVCRAIELAILSSKQHSCPIEIGTGISTPVLDLISELLIATGKACHINHKEALREIDRVSVNTSRAEKELGFKAEIPLRKGLQMTWEAWQ